MAARVAKPDDVTNIDQWLFYYKLGMRNIVKGEDGALLVLDPEQMAADRPAAYAAAKRIPFKKGYDAVAVLASTTASPELRASAAEKLLELRTARTEAAAETMGNYTAIERQLLEAAADWNTSITQAGRKGKAMQVAELTRQLAEADKETSDARYPHRYLVSETELQRKAINYATMDERKLKHALYRTVLSDTTANERVVVTIAADTA